MAWKDCRLGEFWLDRFPRIEGICLYPKFVDPLEVGETAPLNQPTNLSTGGITCPTGHRFGTHGGLSDRIAVAGCSGQPKWSGWFLDGFSVRLLRFFHQKVRILDWRSFSPKKAREMTDFRLVKYDDVQIQWSQHPTASLVNTTSKWIVGEIRFFLYVRLLKNAMY